MPSVFAKLHGAETAVAVGTSMGVALSRPPEQQGQAPSGLIEDLPAELAPSAQLERHRLLISAVADHGPSVTLDQLVATWLRDIDPAEFGAALPSEDEVTFRAVQAGIPPWEAGRFSAAPGSFAAAMVLPIGLVHAGDPRRASIQASAIAQMKDIRGQVGNHAVAAAAALAAGAADAMRPEASPDTVVETVLSYATPSLAARIRAALNAVAQVTDWRSAIPVLRSLDAAEGREAAAGLASGIALFRLVDGEPEPAVAAANLAPDAEARAYVAAGLAGALRGIDAIPPAWTDAATNQIGQATYTVARRTPAQAAQVLLESMTAEAERGLGQLRSLAWSSRG